MRKGKQILHSQPAEKNYPADNFADLLRIRAKQHPEKTAFIFLEDGINETARINYGQLEKRASLLAANLLEKNRKGERCILLFQPGIDFIVAFMGCLIAGVIAVPSYPPRRNRKNERFLAIVNNCEPSAIIASVSIANDLQKNTEDQELIKNIRLINFDKLDFSQEKKDTNTAILKEDIAFLQYTSGSTGMPNGVMVSHGNLIHNSEIIKKAFNHDENLRGVNWLPPFHDMGLIGTLLQPIYVGGQNAIIPPATFLRYPDRWLKAITKYKGNTVGGPNFALDYCCDKISEEDKKEIDLASVEIFFCGSEPIRENTMNRFSEYFKDCGFKTEMFYPCYGLAESTLICTGGDYNEKPLYFSADKSKLETENKIQPAEGNKQALSFTACGFPFFNMEVIIADHNKNEICPEGETGEIWVKGPSVCQGYWNNAVKTKETFHAVLKNDVQQKYMRTGDVGFIHEGQLFITGRLKDLIIIRGQNYFPQDIENTIESCHPALRKYSAAVFSADIKQEERLVIISEVERSFIRNLNKEEVFEAIREAVSEEYGIQPFAIVLIKTGSILKTSSGKIQRLATKKAFLQDELNVIASREMDLKQDSSEETIKPEELTFDEVQNWLINWLSRKVKINPDKIDPEKTILSYGLDSIGLVELEREVNRQFDIEISLSDFMGDNRIGHLTEMAYRLLKEKK